MTLPRFQAEMLPDSKAQFCVSEEKDRSARAAEVYFYNNAPSSVSQPLHLCSRCCGIALACAMQSSQERFAHIHQRCAVELSTDTQNAYPFGSVCRGCVPTSPSIHRMNRFTPAEVTSSNPSPLIDLPEVKQAESLMLEGTLSTFVSMQPAHEPHAAARPAVSAQQSTSRLSQAEQLLDRAVGILKPGLGEAHALTRQLTEKYVLCFRYVSFSSERMFMLSFVYEGFSL